MVESLFRRHRLRLWRWRRRRWRGIGLNEFAFFLDLGFPMRRNALVSETGRLDWAGLAFQVLLNLKEKYFVKSYHQIIIGRLLVNLKLKILSWLKFKPY
jgi:hypothetical protein